MNELHNDNLTSKERYDLKKKEKEQTKKKERGQEKMRVAPGKIRKYALSTLIVVGVIGGIVWLASLVPNLPPITQENHLEDSPSAHLVTTRIPEAIQKHMLEHADGKGAPGIIIQYNCDDYKCEPDLIQKLTTLVKEYPENVYLAPNNYDGKIILTKLGEREILDQFDAQAIRNFIE